MSIHMFMHMSMHMFMHISMHMSTHMSMHMSMHMSTHMSAHMSTHMSIAARRAAYMVKVDRALLHRAVDIVRCTLPYAFAGLYRGTAWDHR